MANPSKANMEDEAADLSLIGCIQELFPELEATGDGIPEAIMLIREYHSTIPEQVHAYQDRQSNALKSKALKGKK